MSALAAIGEVNPRTNKLSFLRIMRSEWIKLFTLRSTWWITCIAVVLNVLITVGIAAAMRFAESLSVAEPGGIPGPDGQPMGMEPGAAGMLSNFVVQGCAFVGQLIFIMLSILIITNEYSSGMIRSTFTTAPRRGKVLLAKMIVISVVCVLVFGISLAIGWAASYAILQGSIAVDLSLTSAASIRILGGFVAEMVLIALFCFGLGALIRSTPGSVAAAIGVLWILPTIMSVVSTVLASGSEPTGWRVWLINSVDFLPTNAGGLVTQVEVAQSSLLGPWEGLAVLGGWVLLSLLFAFVSTARRDV